MVVAEAEVRPGREAAAGVAEADTPADPAVAVAAAGAEAEVAAAGEAEGEEASAVPADRPAATTADPAATTGRRDRARRRDTPRTRATATIAGTPTTVRVRAHRATTAGTVTRPPCRRASALRPSSPSP